MKYSSDKIPWNFPSLTNTILTNYTFVIFISQKFHKLGLSPMHPPNYSFRLTGSIHRLAFIKYILDSPPILNPPSSLDDLLYWYKSTLSDLLDTHASLITKQWSHAVNPWFTLCLQLQAFKTFHRRVDHIYKRASDPACIDLLNSQISHL